MAPGEYVPAHVPNIVTFGTDHVAPPSPLYVQRDDVFAITHATGQSTSEALNFTARLLRASDGQIIPIQRRTRITSLYNPLVDTFSMAEGWLLGFSVSCEQASSRGLTFVRCAIVRLPYSLSVTQNTSQVLLADYVTIKSPIGWPGARIVSGAEGPGRLMNNQPPATAAGVDINFVTNSFARWRLKHLAATLVTSATVANRQVALLSLSSSGTDWAPGAPANQTAGTTVKYAWHIGCTQYTDARGVVFMPLPPDYFVPPNLGFGTFTTNLQAGDQWTINGVSMEEWLDF